MPSCEFPITVDRGYRAHHKALRMWRNAGSDPERHPTRYVKVRCGNCAACLQQRQMEWSFRLSEHQRVQMYPSYHVTLTYAVEPVKGVNKKHIQDFMKRLRHKQKQKISYYIVADYGGKLKRAHYHAILFNISFDPAEIEDVWQHGHIDVQKLVGGNIQYAVDHDLNKKFVSPPEGMNPIFSLKSKKIASHLISDKWKKYLQDGNHFKLNGKYNVSTPRYFADKMQLNPYLMPYKVHMEEDLSEVRDLKLYCDQKNSNSVRLIKKLLKHVNT